MPKLIDLVGKRFGRLVVTARKGATSYGQPIWDAVCDCGNTGSYYGNSLRAGLTKSCGCAQRVALTTHGMTGTRVFTIWTNMIQRCHNPNQRCFADYGSRGITVCDRWRYSFENFLADMSEPPTKRHTLDRIDNSKGYSPDNCRWATPLQQGMNKRNNVLLTLNGNTKTLGEWCRVLGMPKSTLKNRIYKGMSHHDALTKPVLRNRKNGAG